MKSLTICLIFVFFAGSLMAQSGQPVLRNGVLSNGGQAAANADYRVVSTVGQPFIGVTSNATHIHQAGFWYHASGFITSVEQLPGETIPKVYRLEQNYPNPFNPSTTIRFALPKRTRVTLKLYDLLGRGVVALVDEELEGGEYKVLFDARGLPSGVYIYRLVAEGFVETRKLMLLK